MYPLNSEFFVSEDLERRGRKSSNLPILFLPIDAENRLLY